MKTTIILISGKAQAGKDTLCDYLIKQIHNFTKYSIKKYSFADPLKQFCKDVFDLTDQQLWGDNSSKESDTHICWGNLPFAEDKIRYLYAETIKVNIDGWPNSRIFNQPMSSRHFLQTFGTELIRKIYPDCWARATLKAIQKEKCDYAIIGDGRFPNEIDIFSSYDPIVIRLTRNILNYNHKSELALDNYNWSKIKNFYLIDNSKITQTEKEMKVDNVLGYLWDADSLLFKTKEPNVH